MKRTKILRITFLTVLLGLVLLNANGRTAYGKDLPTSFKLKMYGWSNDEKYWAFAESGDYSGGAVGWMDLRDYVIDTAKNSFFKTFEKKITEDEFAEEADAMKAAQKSEMESADKIKALGFNGKLGEEVYKKPLAVWVDTDSVTKQFGEKNVPFSVDKDRYELKLEDKIVEGKDTPSDTKSLFNLSLRKNGGEWKILQADKTPFRNFLQYRIVYASVSPSRSKIAVLVEAVESGYEGAKILHYKGITGSL